MNRFGTDKPDMRFEIELVELTDAFSRDIGLERWSRYLTPIPDRLRDDPVTGLRSAARLVRAAYGPKDSIRDSLPETVTEPLLKSVDLLLKAIARYETHR